MATATTTITLPKLTLSLSPHISLFKTRSIFSHYTNINNNNKNLSFPVASSSSGGPKLLSTDEIKKLKKKPPKLKRALLLSTSSLEEKQEEEEIKIKIRNEEGSWKGVNFKALFGVGKRSLWRRIFFASKKVRSIILLNVIALIYASNIPIVKEVEAITDPATFNAVRFALAAVPFLPFVFRARKDASIRWAGAELGLWISLGYLFQALGLLTSDAGRASFISVLTVIVVPLLDGLLGEVVPSITWFGAVMSVTGVAMLESSGSPPSVGDFLNLLSAIFFGIHMLRTERISRTVKKENFLALLGYEVSAVAISSILWYFLGGLLTGSGEPKLLPSTVDSFWASLVSFPWIPAIYTGIFSTGLCLWVEMTAMRDVSATETAIIYGLEPVWGAGFAWFLLGERWGITGWIGAALVLGGSVTVQIFGSWSSDMTQGNEVANNGEDKLISGNRNGFSASTEDTDDEGEYKVGSNDHNCLSASPVFVRSWQDRTHMSE